MGKMKQLLEREDDMDTMGYWSKAFVVEAIERMEKGALSPDAKKYYSAVRQYFETLAGYHHDPRMADNQAFPTHPA